MSQEALHLLLLTHTPNEAEAIVSLLRNSGNATRAHFIDSLKDFSECLQEKSWDMVLAYPQVGEISHTHLLDQIKRSNLDLPLVLLTQDVNPEIMIESLLAGARTIVPLKESQLLLLVIKRELSNLFNRREVRNLEVRLRDTEKRCQSLLESSRDAIAYVHDGMHIYGNQIYLDLFGYQSTDELAGIPILDMIEGSAVQAFKQFLKTLQQDDGQMHQLQTKGINGKGQPFDMQLQLSPAIYGEEECTQVRVVLNTDNSQLEAKLKEIQSKDQLTGLFNKPYLNTRLEEAVARAIRKGTRGAFLYINLDKFGKTVGEAGLNHSDTIVCAVADTLKSIASQNDVLARTGEDIFCLLRMGCDAEGGLGLAEQIRSKLAALLIEVGNRTVTLTASIGVALITESSSRPDEVIQQAHDASYYSDDGKKTAANHVHLFVEKEAKQSQNDVDLQKILIDAIRNNSFNLAFQPMISLRGDDAEHYEVLLRLTMPNGEEVSAGSFISNEQVSANIRQKIDRWVILQTTKLLGEHRARGHNSRIFINLCADSLVDESLPKWINVAMGAAKLPKGTVIFQFHESDATVMLKQAQKFTRALQEYGIPSSISRFGGAVNPLQTLSHLAVTYVKVDGSFTQELHNPETQKQLKTILDKLHEDEKITIIPSVENAASMASLWQTGAHFLQGYGVQAPQAGMTFNFGDEQEI